MCRMCPLGSQAWCFGKVRHVHSLVKRQTHVERRIIVPADSCVEHSPPVHQRQPYRGQRRKLGDLKDKLGFPAEIWGGTPGAFLWNPGVVFHILPYSISRHLFWSFSLLSVFWRFLMNYLTNWYELICEGDTGDMHLFFYQLDKPRALRRHTCVKVWPQEPRGTDWGLIKYGWLWECHERKHWNKFPGAGSANYRP